MMARSPRLILRTNAKSSAISGFTLIELLVSLAILITVTGGI